MDGDVFSANEFITVFRLMCTAPEETSSTRGVPPGPESLPPAFVSCEICAELLETAA